MPGLTERSYDLHGLEQVDVFRIELEGSGWRVVDDCLNFGPYETEAEALDVARALNAHDWTKGGDIQLDTVEPGSLGGLSHGPSIN